MTASEEATTDVTYDRGGGAEIHEHVRAFVIHLTPNCAPSGLEWMGLLGVGLLVISVTLAVIDAVFGGVEGELHHHLWSLGLLPYAIQLTHQLLWRRFGRETVRVVDGELTIEHSIGGWAWKRTVALDAIERLHGNYGARSYWFHNDWRNKEDAAPPFTIPAVRFEISGQRRDGCFAAGIPPAEVRRIGQALAKHTGKPWVNEFPGRV